MEQKVRREVQEVRWVRSGSDVGVRSRDRAWDVTVSPLWVRAYEDPGEAFQVDRRCGKVLGAVGI